MFCIDVKKTKALLTELQNKLSTLNHIISEIEGKTADYFMNDEQYACQCQIKTELERMKEERTTYLKLISVLREIVWQYEETEEQILEFGMAYPKRKSAETGWILIEYSEKINEFIKQVIV